jgi:hypothetical protein
MHRQTSFIIKPYAMQDFRSLVDYMHCNCSYWIDRTTAQQRYNISDKTWKKLERKKTYVVRMYTNKPVRYWEPDIQRMLECDRTGQLYTKSELLPIYNSRIFCTDNSFIYHHSLFWKTIALLVFWTLMPQVGFYDAGVAVWNIVLIVVASGALFYSTRFGDLMYWTFRATSFTRPRPLYSPRDGFQKKRPDDYFNLN